MTGMGPKLGGIHLLDSKILSWAMWDGDRMGWDMLAASFLEEPE